MGYFILTLNMMQLCTAQKKMQAEINNICVRILKRGVKPVGGAVMPNPYSKQYEVPPRVLWPCNVCNISGSSDRIVIRQLLDNCITVMAQL